MKRWLVRKATPRAATKIREAKGARSFLTGPPLGTVDAPTKAAAITAAMDKFASLGLNASNIDVEETDADLAR